MPTLKQLTKKHATYIQENERWTLLEKLVAGGKKVDLETKKSLLENPDGRPENIIKARAKLAPYVNILGSALQRVVAQLFQEPANFEGSKDEFWVDWLDSKAFVLDGDDDSKASFTLGLKKAAMMAFTNGKAIAEISTRYSGEATNLKQQREFGELDPYVVILPQSAMWDWDVDANGFRYVKICRYRLEKKGWTDTDVPVYSFTIYERQEKKIVVSQYEIRPKPDLEQYKTNPASFKLENANQDDVVISTVEVNGFAYENVEIFNLNGKFDFPIKTLTFPPELCIGDQLLDLCIEFFRIRAGIAWKFQTVLFSMPVVELPSGVESVDEIWGKNTKLGDGLFLPVPNGTKISTLDMGGGGIPIAVSYLEKIAADLLNQLQQISTSAASSNSGLGRSAEKTREDRKPEVSMLEVTGMEINLFADAVLDCCAIARGENIDWTVDGFHNYLGEGIAEMIADIELMLKNAINVPTLRRESIAKVASAFGKKYTLTDEAKEAIADEIAALPDETLNNPMSLPLPPTPPQEGQPPQDAGQADGSGGGDTPDESTDTGSQDAALEAAAFDV
jgi:hypothetical protein